MDLADVENRWLQPAASVYSLLRPVRAMSSITSLPSAYQSLVYGSLFRKADADSSGRVSSSELSSSLTQIKATLGDNTLKADALFSSLDANDDNAISVIEFRKGLTKVASGATAGGKTNAASTRAAVLASYVAGNRANLVSALFGSQASAESSTEYSSLGDVYGVINQQYGTNLVSYSANGSTYNSPLLGALLNATA